MRPERSWLVLTDGYLTARRAKTAHGVIRYSSDRIAAVLDRAHAGRSLAEVLPHLGRDAPIVASIEEGLSYKPTSLLLGVATPGGWIPEHWRRWIIDAIEARLEIANGLHRFLGDDAEFVSLAKQHGAALWDVRKAPADISLFTGRSLNVPQRIVLTVGSDCAVGKMTVALELERAARAAGRKPEFVATGQTGILISGWGISVDGVVADFLAGAVERLVCDASLNSDVLIVEGQGSLWHPAYSGVTLGLLHGCAPEALVLCHTAGREAIEEPPYTPLPPLTEMIEMYEWSAATVQPAKVACVAVNTSGLTQADARAAIDQIEDETNLPAGDVMKDDAPKLWSAVEAALE